MISFKNDIKKSTLSFKVIVVCLLLSGSLTQPSFARSYCYIVDGTVLINGIDCDGPLVIDNSVTSIRMGAFEHNHTLTSVTIGSSVTDIGIGAFYDNNLLTFVTIGNSVTSIGESAFAYSGLTSVTIPNSVTSIDDAAFLSNTALTSVTIGNFVTSIGDAAFSGNINLEFVNIGNSVRTIGNNAFSDNTALTSVTIPNSVTSIGAAAFYGNTALTSVTIGNSVTSIGNSAFRGNTVLRSVTIPDSVTSIGDGAFESNTALTSVTIGNSVTSIGESAFAYSGLTSVTIPNSVTSIGNSAFQNNTVLRSVTIPDSVTSIGAGAFLFSNLLASVTFLGIAALTDDVVGDVAFSGVAVGAIANVAYNATGFPPEGDDWKGLIVRYASAPPVDSDSSSSKTVVTITPTVVNTADASFKLTNRKYLSKYAMKTKLSMNKSFKRNPEDLYKYSIFKSSKESCGMRGNYVMRYENSKTCDLYITRTNAKGISNKYWVKINYTK